MEKLSFLNFISSLNDLFKNYYTLYFTVMPLFFSLSIVHSKCLFSFSLLYIFSVFLLSFLPFLSSLYALFFYAHISFLCVFLLLLSPISVTYLSFTLFPLFSILSYFIISSLYSVFPNGFFNFSFLILIFVQNFFYYISIWLKYQQS